MSNLEVGRERERPERSFRRVREERHYEDTTTDRRRARNRTTQSTHLRYQIPSNYHQNHHQNQRYERNSRRQNATTMYNYDVRTRNDNYMMRRRQRSSRNSQRHNYDRRRNRNQRRSMSPQHHQRRVKSRIDSIRRNNNDSPSPIRHRTPTGSESIKRQQINTQFASPSYLSMADMNSVSLKDPPPKLLILDLNGTLVYRYSVNNTLKKDIILRPYMNKFMQYIFESNRFIVMVWSSAQPINVDKMVRTAFGSYEEKLIAKWTRKNLNLSDKDYNSKVETIKDLEKVWKEFNNNKILPQIVWDQTNTILIDDSCEKTKLQPYNAIHLPQFDNERWKSENDRELENVIKYLSKLRKQSNVSAYIKEYPYISK